MRAGVSNMTRPPGGGLSLMRLYLKPMFLAWTAQSLQRFNTFNTNSDKHKRDFFNESYSGYIRRICNFTTCNLLLQVLQDFKAATGRGNLHLFCSQLILSMKIVISTEIRTHHLLTWINWQTLLVRTSN